MSRLRNEALIAAEQRARDIAERESSRCREMCEIASKRAASILGIAPPELRLPDAAKRTRRVGEEWVFQEDGMDFTMRAVPLPTPIRGSRRTGWALLVRARGGGNILVFTLSQLGRLIKEGRVALDD